MPEATVNADADSRSIRHRREAGQSHGRPVHVETQILLHAFNRLAVGTSQRAIAAELETLSGLWWDHREAARLIQAHRIACRSDLTQVRQV
jgi:hypothetical protein